MFCIVLTLGLICADAPKLTPEQAAAVLASHQYVPQPVHGHGSRIIVIGSSPTAGPFGEFKPYPPFPPLNCCSVYVTRLPRGNRGR